MTVAVFVDKVCDRLRGRYFFWYLSSGLRSPYGSLTRGWLLMTALRPPLSGCSPRVARGADAGGGVEKRWGGMKLSERGGGRNGKLPLSL